jgi:tripartite-type tricarboxylate transporter receptor subunit TctC
VETPYRLCSAFKGRLVDAVTSTSIGFQHRKNRRIKAVAKIGTEEMPTRRHLLGILGGACVATNLPALAAEFPSGPITFVVSFPAGGSIDVVVRAMAGRLQEQFGKAIVVENRAGAGGVLAAGDVVKAAPDGQTLLAAASSLAANPTLVKALPYDTLQDLQAVALIFRTPLVLVVDPKLPVHTVTELVALLKAKPGQINFGHGGPGSAIHLAGELFQVMTGTDMTVSPIAARRLRSTTSWPVTWR